MPDTKPTSRILMRDGTWLVPAEQRPIGWEKYGLAEIATPEPTEEEIAASMGDIAAHEDAPESPAAPATATEDPPDRLRIMRDYNRAWAIRKKQFQELASAVRQSAKDNKAEDILNHGLLLAAGMWTETPGRLSQWSGLSRPLVNASIQRLLHAGIWTRHHGHFTVHMGETTESIPDIGFWMNAMVGAGIIDGNRQDGGGMLYSAIKQ